MNIKQHISKIREAVDKRDHIGMMGIQHHIEAIEDEIQAMEDEATADLRELDKWADKMHELDTQQAAD